MPRHADLQRGEFGSGPKRDRIETLLKKLFKNIRSIRNTLSAHVRDSPQAPILLVPPGHRVFYDEVILPYGTLLQRAFLEVAGLSEVSDLFLDDPTDEQPKQGRLNAISWALDRWDEMLEDNEVFEWYERGFDVEGARDFVAMPWFQPDEWSQNLEFLQSVLVDRPPYEIPQHVQYRLKEIYRAFAHGLWMAAIALSRSLVEFSLKTNAKRLGIDPIRQGVSGRTEDKSLKQLGDDVGCAIPALALSINTVRDTGNRILHPKKRDVIALPTVMRAEALECIRAARIIVETLYSEARPAIDR